MCRSHWGVDCYGKFCALFEIFGIQSQWLTSKRCIYWLVIVATVFTCIFLNSLFVETQISIIPCCNNKMRNKKYPPLLSEEFKEDIWIMFIFILQRIFCSQVQECHHTSRMTYVSCTHTSVMALKSILRSQTRKTLCSCIVSFSICLSTSFECNLINIHISNCNYTVSTRSGHCSVHIIIRIP
jgi:hypothetical protein